jgi:KRAB domain-containing zinc finger protein
MNNLIQSTDNTSIKHETPVEFVLILPQLMTLNPIKEENSVNKQNCSNDKKKYAENLKKCPVWGCKREYRKSHYFNKKIERECCGMKFKCRNVFKKHVNKDHMSGKIFECDTCLYATDFKIRFLSHKRVHDPSHVSQKLRKFTNENDKHFSCKICAKKFKTKSYLLMHVLSHSKPFKCDNCDTRFGTKHQLLTHEIMKRHGQFLSKAPMKTFACDGCGMVFFTRQQIYSHLKEVHRRSDIHFQCDYCLKIFKRKSHLIRHIFSHADLLTCNICGEKRNKFTMHQHYEVKHLNKPKYECDLCARIFKYKTALEIHIKRIHSKGEFSCYLCNQKYKKINGLLDHDKIHIGVRQWKCFKCSYIGTRLFNLTKHIEAIHDKVRATRKKKNVKTITGYVTRSCLKKL